MIAPQGARAFRDPERIGEILAIIGRLWKHFPDMRLMQLIAAAWVIEPPGEGNPLHAEDGYLMFRLGMLEAALRLKQEKKDDPQ